ncbi:hypothetical protein ABZ897_11025 [Nonomuraea sp. NPDC046802]|uniref:hypothetical protein n=1 Tax=Nonomuraea sp. NPDC046802 TaxID=3154919 RepID=UPI0033CDDAB0
MAPKPARKRLGQCTEPVSLHEVGGISEDRQVDPGESGLHERIAIDGTLVVKDGHDLAVADHRVLRPEIYFDETGFGHGIEHACVLGEHSADLVVVPADVDLDVGAIGERVLDRRGERFSPRSRDRSA